MLNSLNTCWLRNKRHQTQRSAIDSPTANFKSSHE